MIKLTFKGPSGPYTLDFEPEEDAAVDVRHGDQRLSWSIEAADGDGTLSGLTRGTTPIWGDVFWFTLTIGPPARIEYWGDRILVRTDHQVRP